MEILAAGSAAVCVLPDEGIAVNLGESPINVAMGAQEISVLCDDVIVPTTFVTPTIVSVECLAVDYMAGVTGSATVKFSFHDCVTAGSPCRASWRLVSQYDSAVICDANNKGIEATAQPNMAAYLDPYASPSNRNCLYDLWWKWTSGSEFIDWTLVAAGAVFAPAEGDGDEANIYP